MIDWLRKLIHSASEILFPPACVGCRKAGTLLCAECRLTIEIKTDDEKSIIAPLSYRDRRVRSLIWHLKYRGSSEAAAILAEFLEEAILTYLSDDIALAVGREPIVVVPVPATARHKRRRGWNQAESLARALAALSPASFRLAEDAIAKIKDTPTQVSRKTRAERLFNLDGAFCLAAQAEIAGRVVCAVDDVTTTGATLSAVLGELAKGKPRRLFAVAVSR